MKGWYFLLLLYEEYLEISKELLSMTEVQSRGGGSSDVSMFLVLLQSQKNL